MNQSLIAQVWGVIQGRTRKNAVKASTLESLTHLPRRELQHLINEAREQGRLIGSCARGYFEIQTPEDAEYDLKHYRKQAETTFKTFKRRQRQYRTRFSPQRILEL